MTAAELLNAEGLGERLDRFRTQLFRMETLPEYTVDSDGDDYQLWLTGAPVPVSDRKRRWMDVLRRERAAGKVSTRVRILSEQLTDYERYSCQAGYALNAEAGEDIRILHRGEHPIPVLDDRDFWIVDDVEAVGMVYDEHGRFCGAEVLSPDELGSLILARDIAWEAAEPFPAWWARHPELHRKPVA